MKWIRVDDTTWPVDDDGEVQWQLRHGALPNQPAASVMSAYAALTDPTISQRDAIEKLKRARRAVSSPVETPQP